MYQLLTRVPASDAHGAIERGRKELRSGSNAQNQPFVASAARRFEPLLEDDLFGHGQGSPPSRVQKKGRLEAADAVCVSG